jgi:DNA polymerase-3 subunit epsilon
MDPINSFTAIDFETAQGARNTICQIGLVRVENGTIIHKLDILVQPPGNNYFWRNTQIHGIRPEHTLNSQTFGVLWSQIEPFIGGKHVVAHNMAFDNSCLSQTLNYYGLKPPQFQKYCTYQIYGNSLRACCDKYGIALNHHNALSDALACAELFIRHHK